MTRFGRIDTLVNNAGIFIAKPFTEYSEADFAGALGVNLAGFFRITQLAIAEMEKQGSGHVVQVTTSLVDHAIDGVPSVLASLTKGGLNAATKSLAIEYAKRGIRVNAVSPGIIKTPMHPAETHAALGALHPVGHMGEIKRHRRCDPLSRRCRLRDRRNPARRRRPERRPLNHPSRSEGMPPSPRRAIRRRRNRRRPIIGTPATALELILDRRRGRLGQEGLGM